MKTDRGHDLQIFSAFATENFWITDMAFIYSGFMAYFMFLNDLFDFSLFRVYGSLHVLE